MCRAYKSKSLIRDSDAWDSSEPHVMFSSSRMLRNYIWIEIIEICVLKGATSGFFLRHAVPATVISEFSLTVIEVWRRSLAFLLLPNRWNFHKLTFSYLWGPESICLVMSFSFPLILQLIVLEVLFSTFSFFSILFFFFYHCAGGWTQTSGPAFCMATAVCLVCFQLKSDSGGQLSTLVDHFWSLVVMDTLTGLVFYIWEVFFFHKLTV